jgi:hypothetical protein
MPCVRPQPTNLVHGSEVLLLDRVLQCEHVVLVVVPHEVLLLQQPRRLGGVNRSVLNQTLPKEPVGSEALGLLVVGVLMS